MTRKITVLMVDDEKQFRDTTRKLLRKKGLETMLAASGEEALDLIGSGPDAVVLDIKMPGMDGHETLKKIKEKAPDIPVIMLTGHGGRPSAQKALDTGACDYLSKPCDIGLLAEKIKEACRPAGSAKRPGEKKLADIMVPIEEYALISIDRPVHEAVRELKFALVHRVATQRLIDSGHRSILATDSRGRIAGVLTMRRLLELILPDYLNAPKPSLADSIAYSPMFWRGVFTSRVRETRDFLVREVMLPCPCTIDGDANLMEAVFTMLENSQRRLLVTVAGQEAGIVREQDLFIEMEKVHRDAG